MIKELVRQARLRRRRSAYIEDNKPLLIDASEVETYVDEIRAATLPFGNRSREDVRAEVVAGGTAVCGFPVHIRWSGVERRRSSRRRAEMRNAQPATPADQSRALGAPAMKEIEA